MNSRKFPLPLPMPLPPLPMPLPTPNHSVGGIPDAMSGEFVARHPADDTPERREWNLMVADLAVRALQADSVADEFAHNMRRAARVYLTSLFETTRLPFVVASVASGDAGAAGGEPDGDGAKMRVGQYPVVGVSLPTDVGRLVYRDAGGLLTVTKPSDTAKPVGVVNAYHGGTYCDVGLFCED